MVAIDLFVSGLKVHQSEAGSIPNLIDKMAVSFHTLFRHLDVAALGGEGG